MLTIDARWVNQTGIGTHLRQVIPGIRQAFPELAICLLGDEAELRKLGWIDRPNTLFVPLKASMYSLTETMAALPRDTGGNRIIVLPALQYSASLSR